MHFIDPLIIVTPLVDKKNGSYRYNYNKEIPLPQDNYKQTNSNCISDD